MKRRTLLQAGAAGLTPAASITLAGAAHTGREVLALTQGWRFHDGDIPFPKILGHGWTYGSAKAGNAQGAAAPDYDDSDWPLVNLPHDFAASQPIEQEANVAQGYRRRGMAWYRQSIRFEPEDRGRHLELQIDGGTRPCRAASSLGRRWPLARWAGWPQSRAAG
jgi:beta-galactosidase